MHVYLCIPAMPTRLWVYAPLLYTPHGPAASLSEAPSPSPDRAHLLEHGVERGHGLHLPYISPTSPLHLPYIFPTSHLHLPYISAHAKGVDRPYSPLAVGAVVRVRVLALALAP